MMVVMICSTQDMKLLNSKIYRTYLYLYLFTSTAWPMSIIHCNAIPRQLTFKKENFIREASAWVKRGELMKTVPFIYFKIQRHKISTRDNTSFIIVTKIRAKTRKRLFFYLNRSYNYRRLCRFRKEMYCTQIIFSSRPSIYHYIWMTFFSCRKVNLLEDRDGNIHLRNLSVHPASNEEDGNITLKYFSMVYSTV